MAEKSKATAFIFYDGKVYTGSAHWRIIETLWRGDIAEFLYLSFDNLNMAWGWIWETGVDPDTGEKEVTVEFYTEIAPHHQSHGAFPAAIDAIEKQFGVKVLDVETPEPPPGILERYTPTDIQQSESKPTDYDEKYKPTDVKEQPDQTWQGYTPTTQGYTVKHLKTTDVGEVTISTIDARDIPGENSYETLVIGGGMDGSLFPSATADTALHTHDNIVKLVQDYEAGSFSGDDSGHKYFGKAASSETMESFGLFNNKLYFGKQHHADIIERIMDEDDYDWEDFFDNPMLFGWYHKPSKKYMLSTDTSSPQNTELAKPLEKALKSKYGEGVKMGLFEFNDDDWQYDGTPTPKDIDLSTLPEDDDSEQLKLFSKVHADPGHMDAPGLSVIKVDPPEGSMHENKEKPFIWYRPTNTLFETTDYCHHENVIPLINQYIIDHTGDLDFSPDAWIMGDITHPDFEGRTWIKFIHNGPIPNSVVEYFKAAYPDYDVIYSGNEGWQELPEDRIDKTTAHQPRVKDAAYMSFGFVNGHLIFGYTHHQAIMAQLLNNGWTWEQLFTIPQVWGWLENDRSDRAEVRFTSDAGVQGDEATQEQCIQAMEDALGKPVVRSSRHSVRGVNPDNYGRGMSGKDNINHYLEGDSAESVKQYIYSDIPEPPVPPRENPDWVPDNLHMAPTKFPPPRQASTIKDMEPGAWDPEGGFNGCFGYLEDTDTLYLGDTHHALIISQLIEEGMSWEILMGSRQMWGWAETDYGSYYADNDDKVIELRFATDEARQDKGIKPKVRAAFQQAFPGWKINLPQGYGYKSNEEYGMRAREQYLDEKPPNKTDDEWKFFKSNGYWNTTPEQLANFLERGW